jgi:hypothetical protein
MLNNFMFYSIGLIMEALLGTPSPVGLSRTPSPLSRSPSPAHRGYKMESKSPTEISVLAGVLRDIFFEFCLATFCDVDADFT